MLKKSIYSPKSLIYLALFSSETLKFCISSLGLCLQLILVCGMRQGPVLFSCVGNLLSSADSDKSALLSLLAVPHLSEMSWPFTCGSISGLSRPSPLAYMTLKC